MFFHFHRGIIALDIDGTLTAAINFIHPDVVSYLDSLVCEGWKLMFITGRPFAWGYKVLQHLSVPYIFAVQNGALILEMPSCKVLDRRYLTVKELPFMASLCQEERTDFVVYAGFDNQDWCYFRPTHFQPELLEYMERRTRTLQEKWQALSSFKDLPVTSFSSFKCFATEEPAKRLSQRIEKELKLHAPPNRDPFDPHYFVIQVTHPEATKGLALHHYKNLLNLPGQIIAAGDDYNDLTMLQEADIAIVMASAPSDLQALAHIIAPPATANGIIQGLQQAIQLATTKRDGFYHA